MKLLVKGCKNFYEFKISYKNSNNENIIQYIYLFGENHKYKGNALDIIQFFLKNSECPINILNETDRSIEKQNRNYLVKNNSNVILIHEKYGKCSSLKKNTPKQNQLLFSKNYIKECIIPLKGKIKFWSMDIRNLSFFSYLQSNDEYFSSLMKKLDNIIGVNNTNLLLESSIKRFKYNEQIILDNLSDENKKKYNEIINEIELYIIIYPLLIKDIFNINLYKSNTKMYYFHIWNFAQKYKIPLEKMIQYYPYINKLYKKISYMFEKDQDNINLNKNEKYKNHLYLIDSLNYLKEETIKSILNNIDYYSFVSLTKDNIYMDIYTILRIIRLIRENKNQYILGFFGDSHAYALSVFLSISSIFQYKTDEQNNYKIEGKIYTFDSQNPKRYVEIEILKPCNKTDRMLLYELLKKNY